VGWPPVPDASTAHTARGHTSPPAPGPSTHHFAANGWRCFVLAGVLVVTLGVLVVAVLS
jgi:hypothetical protein